jgi:hypothetical protein
MEIPHLADDVEELSLLLPGWQIMALAEAAELEGLTVAQYVRRLINKALACSPVTG